MNRSILSVIRHITAECSGKTLWSTHKTWTVLIEAKWFVTILMDIHKVMEAVEAPHSLWFNLLRGRLYFLCLHLLDSEGHKANERAIKALVTDPCCLRNRSNISAAFVLVSSQITRTTTLTCPTPRWTPTSGARRPERRSVLPWRSSPTSSRSIMGINSSFQTGTWSPQEVSSLSRGDVPLCRMSCRSVLLVLSVQRWRALFVAHVVCLCCGINWPTRPSLAILKWTLSNHWLNWGGSVTLKGGVSGQSAFVYE